MVPFDVVEVDFTTVRRYHPLGLEDSVVLRDEGVVNAELGEGSSARPLGLELCFHREVLHLIGLGKAELLMLLH